MKHERLILPFAIKTLADADGACVFEGHGSVFGGVDAYGDTIAKGAYKATLREWKAKGKLPKMLLQHGGGFFGGSAVDMIPIGKWDEMREDDTGLYVKGHLFDVDTDRTKHVAAALRAGELDGLSIGFHTRKSKMDEETGIRTLTEVDLWEVSHVTFPADSAARVSAVKTDGELPSEREFERWLRREAGLTEAQAKTVVAKGYRQVRREAMPSEDACESFVIAARNAALTLTGRTE